MKYLKSSLIFLFSFVLVSPAWSALNLELTQGMDAALPIAIVPFAQETADAPGQQSVSQIVSQDLQNSGQFRVKTPGLMGQRPGTAEEVNRSYWRDHGVDDVLVGQVQNLGSGRYKVSFQLLSTMPNEPVLLSQTFTTSTSGLRQLSHHISDLVYEKLTGVRGIFSTKIAYVLVQRNANKERQYSLEVSDADGFAPRALLVSREPIMSPAWSPDARYVAYVSFEGRKASVFLQDIASGRRELISEQPGINGAPSFSPDGRKLALVLTLTGNPKIYTYDLQSHKLSRLTEGYAIDTEPRWAPDGQSIVFTSSRGGNPQIYRYLFSNGQVERVSFDGNYNSSASFLPNGKEIVMMHRENRTFGIAREDLDSGRIDVLAQTGADESPSISPNGKMIIYATEYGGRGVLALVSTDGRIKVRLPAREGNVREPSWSPYLT